MDPLRYHHLSVFAPGATALTRLSAGLAAAPAYVLKKGDHDGSLKRSALPEESSRWFEYLSIRLFGKTLRGEFFFFLFLFGV